jgi:diguanylate cyclase (GGDEF)-like protein
MKRLLLGQRTVKYSAMGLLGLSFLAYLAFVLGLRGGPADNVLGIWAYETVLVGAAVSALLRALLIPRERLGWALLGLALALYAAAEIYYVIETGAGNEPPTPSPADIGYLGFYPVAYAGLIALVREQHGAFPAVRWLDGLIAGSAVAALAAALALDPIVAASTSGSSLEVAINLAYPIADLTLLALVVAVAALSGWRPGASWLALGAGLLVTGVTDVVYLFQSARDSYVEDGAVDVAWLLSMLLLAVAAWLPAANLRAAAPRVRLSALLPTAAGLTAVGILFADRYLEIPTVAALLALLTLVGVILRLAISRREADADLAARAHEALTDPLTGLSNRRRFFDDLGRAVARPPRSSVGLLVLCDLDGFKAYNDSFGHPAGDALLARVGARLDEFARGHDAVAYRLGGDEFCLLAECTPAAVEDIVAGALEALRERGEGFVITAAQGSVLIPGEADEAETALQLADRRMYAAKNRERTSAGTQSRDILMTALRECRPKLHDHLVGVAGLVLALAEEIGLEGERRDEVVRAAELHDVGKVAIPETILGKPGALDAREREFMRQHTVIGERIVASAPALVPVARLVRSTHERPDGTGYPDGLTGEAIPFGSRMIAVCDAYEAMVGERAYSPPMPPEAALAELRRGADSQFDAELVEAFCRMIAAPERALSSPAAAPSGAPTSSA